MVWALVRTDPELMWEETLAQSEHELWEECDWLQVNLPISLFKDEILLKTRIHVGSQIWRGLNRVEPS